MKKITQKDLRNFTVLENKIAEITTEFRDVRDEIITKLAAGMKIETGDRTASIKLVERRNVSWRQVVIRIKSLGYVNRILAATKPSTFFKLEVN